MGIAQRRVMQMFDAGKLMHEFITTTKNTPEPVVEEVEISVDDNSKEYEPELINEEYDLDAIDDMKELRAIADKIGAPYKVSKKDQREAIRNHRKENDE